MQIKGPLKLIIVAICSSEYKNQKSAKPQKRDQNLSEAIISDGQQRQKNEQKSCCALNLAE